jgi:hypothetical protein
MENIATVANFVVVVMTHHELAVVSVINHYQPRSIPGVAKISLDESECTLHIALELQGASNGSV